jgi:5-hydroxyisourate hydrolase
MPSLSTHVLDLYNGKPAASVKVELFYKAPNADWILLHTVLTNADGRTDEKLVTDDSWQPGTYELHFYVADYFASLQVPLTDPPFLTTIPVRFSMQQDAGHYHVPLLVSPWGYQVYRGS